MISDSQVRAIAALFLDSLQLEGKRVLLVVPDATRSAPVGLLFKTIFEQIGAKVKNLDVMIALGTHPPMSEEQINQRLEISAQERAQTYSHVAYLNHEWDNPDALQTLGTIPSSGN